MFCDHINIGLSLKASPKMLYNEKRLPQTQASKLVMCTSVNPFRHKFRDVFENCRDKKKNRGWLNKSNNPTPYN